MKIDNEKPNNLPIGSFLSGKRVVSLMGIVHSNSDTFGQLPNTAATSKMNGSAAVFCDAVGYRYVIYK